MRAQVRVLRFPGVGLVGRSGAGVRLESGDARVTMRSLGMNGGKAGDVAVAPGNAWRNRDRVAADPGGRSART